MRVIGVVGQPSSGKDTVAEYIASKSFTHISSGDAIRADMRAVGLPIDRTSMSAFVAERRAEVGNEYPVNKIVESISSDTVISGMRNTTEVDVCKRKFGKDFILIAVEAPLETRYGWAKARGRIGDNISFEQFKKEEENERSKNSGTHEVDAVIKMADHTITNDSTKEKLFEKVAEIVEQYERD